MISGSICSINFLGRLNLLIRDKFNAEVFLLLFQAFHVSIKIHSTNDVCSKPFFGSVCCHQFFNFVYKMVVLGTPSKSKKWHHKSSKWRKHFYKFRVWVSPATSYPNEKFYACNKVVLCSLSVFVWLPFGFDFDRTCYVSLLLELHEIENVLSFALYDGGVHVAWR